MVRTFLNIAISVSVFAASTGVTTSRLSQIETKNLSSSAAQQNGPQTKFTSADFRKVTAGERRQYLSKMQDMYLNVLLPTQKIEAMRQVVCLKEALKEAVSADELYQSFAIDINSSDPHSLTSSLIRSKNGYCMWFLKDQAAANEQNAYSILEAYKRLRKSMAKAQVQHCGTTEQQKLDKWGRNTSFIPCHKEISHLFKQLRIPFIAKDMWVAPSVAQMTDREWNEIKQSIDGYYRAERAEFDRVNYYSRLALEFNKIDKKVILGNEENYANDKITFDEYKNVIKNVAVEKRNFETAYLKYYNQVSLQSVIINNNSTINKFRKDASNEYFELINTQPILALLKIDDKKFQNSLKTNLKTKDYLREILNALYEHQRIFTAYHDTVKNLSADKDYRRVLSIAEMSNFVKYFDQANLFQDKTALYSATIQHDLQSKMYQDLGITIGSYVGAAIICSALFVMPQGKVVGVALAAFAVKAAVCDLSTNLALNIYFAKVAADDYRSRYFQFFATSGMNREGSELFFRELKSLDEARRNYLYAALSVPMFVGTRQMIKAIINKNIITKEAAAILERAAGEVR